MCILLWISHRGNNVHRLPRYNRTARYPDLIHIPQLPALKTLRIETYAGSISNHIADILFSLHLALQLSSVTFKLLGELSSKVHVHNTWRGIDSWLVRLARTGAREKDGLKVEMRSLMEDTPAAERFLRWFKEAGGEVHIIGTLMFLT